jgi:hypothetical protein
VKIVITLTVIGATAAAAPATARVHHAAKHRHARHLHARHGAPGRPLRLIIPGVHPGYPYGGPLYSTCDRINADRMLVGTCR